MGLRVVDPMEVIETLKESEAKLFKCRRDLVSVEQHMEAIRYSYIRPGIEGKYSGDREAALRELLSEDEQYLGLLVQEGELAKLIDDHTVEVNYYSRIHALQLAMIHVPPG